MDSTPFVKQLVTTKEFFDRSTQCLTEEDSSFRLTDDSMTVAAQVAHVAQTVDWFLEGAFRPEGFDMNFEALHAEVLKVESLAAAREWLERSFSEAQRVIAETSMEELSQPLPAEGLMGGAPRHAITAAIADHTAHHRGALTAYSRLCGHVPAMPYMEM